MLFGVSTLLLAFIGVALLFVGYLYIRKAGVNASSGSDIWRYLYEDNNFKDSSGMHAGDYERAKYWSKKYDDTPF